jgi:hypothetical protein
MRNPYICLLSVTANPLMSSAQLGLSHVNVNEDPPECVCLSFLLIPLPIKLYKLEHKLMDQM